MTETLIIFILAAVGMTHILVDGKIFAGLRAWVGQKYPKIFPIFQCYMCMGWWVGLLLGLILYRSFIFAFCLSFAGSFVANFAAYLQNYLEAATIKNTK